MLGRAAVEGRAGETAAAGATWQLTRIAARLHTALLILFNRLNQRLHFKALAILTLQMAVGFGVFELLRLGVELERASQPVGNVAEVTMHAGMMRLER